MDRRQPNLAGELLTQTVTALLGFLLITDAKYTSQPLQAIDMIAGGFFIIAAISSAFTPPRRR